MIKTTPNIANTTNLTSTQLVVMGPRSSGRRHPGKPGIKHSGMADEQPRDNISGTGEFNSSVVFHVAFQTFSISEHLFASNALMFNFHYLTVLPQLVTFNAILSFDF